MDFDASKYDSGANDALAPALHLVKLISQNLDPAKLEKKSELVIIDLGCGPGNTAHILAQNFPNSTVVGVDIDVKMVEFARQKNYRATFYAQNIEQAWLQWLPQLKELKEQVDIVFSNYTLHWVDHTDQLASNVRHLLKPNTGLFVGNLLYCGQLHSNDVNEQSLLEKSLNYPTEQEFVSKFLFSFKNSGKFSDFKLDYQEPVSMFEKNFFINSFINIPLKWYRKFDRCSQTSDQSVHLLNETIKKLILKQRIVGEKEDHQSKCLIETKQQLWVFVIKA